MHHIFLTRELEQSIKKFTLALVVSFALLVGTHHKYRNRYTLVRGFEIWSSMRNLNKLKHPQHFPYVQLAPAASSSQESSVTPCFEWLNQYYGKLTLNSPEFLPLLPQSSGQFRMRWRSMSGCMHALRAESFSLEDRVRVRAALSSVFKVKGLLRSVSGRDLVFYHTYKNGQKCIRSMELFTDFSRSKRITFTSNGFLIQGFQDKVVPFLMRTQGVVSTTLSSDLRKKRLPYSALQLTTAMLEAHKLPLRLYFNRGTQFFVLYRGIKNERTEEVQCTNILFIKVKKGSKQLALYPYAHQQKKSCVFTEEGKPFQSQSRTAFIRPLSGGRVSSVFGSRVHPMFGYRHHHKGIDLAAPLGTPVMAAASGVVEKVGWVRGYGKFIRIRHALAYHTAYGHLSNYAKRLRPGMPVQQGQVIGFVGATGNATGNHLHFEVIKNGAQVNPLNAQKSARPIEGMSRAQYRRFRWYINYLNTVYNKLPNNHPIVKI